jgi:hypothetical protein
MKKDWKYVLYISLAFAIFVTVKLLAPKQYSWQISFAHEDKNPYGGFALNELIPGIFPTGKINHSYRTLYELKDSLKSSDNIVVISSNFMADKEDSRALLKHVEQGGSAFISAEYYSENFADTVGISTKDYLFKSGDFFARKDSAALKLVSSAIDTTNQFFYKRDNVHNYFNRIDSTTTTVIARNDYHMPVTIRRKWGKGNLILNSTPLVFTNIYLLSNENHRFVSATLSYLPSSNVTWTEYYHLGRMEAGTPLRFILNTPPLKWAYYITVIALLFFVIFEMKRKQRIIPIVKPLANTTLEFVTTIGNLYFQRGDHKNIAEKKIYFFLDQIRTKYWINTTSLDEIFIHTLGVKTGHTEAEARKLVNSILAVKSKPAISAGELVELNKQIENFSTQPSLKTTTYHGR